jgi:catechol 2,3-dioxygenase-like lactoylglutathione lyase family enzyme
MNFADSYAVIVTDKLRECRDFYTTWLDFQPVFQASWFVLLASGGERPVTLAFMHSEHPSSPPSPLTYGGGMFLTLQVEDAAAEYERLQAAGLRFDHPLMDEPWGQRRFGVVDPAGMWLDFVEQIEPADGWWERYAAEPL